MRTHFLAIILMSAAILAPNPATAMTAEAFLAKLESAKPDSPDTAAFYAYLRGAMDTMVLYTKALESDGHAGMFCVPTGTDFDLEDLRAMVSAALATRPDDAGMPLPQIVIEAFGERYPCP